MEEYRSEQMHWTANPKRGDPHGIRNTVVVQGPVAYKEHVDLNRAGKVIHTRKHRLSAAERAAVLDRRFVPTMWHCCHRNRTRITRGRSRSRSRST